MVVTVPVVMMDVVVGGERRGGGYSGDISLCLCYVEYLSALVVMMMVAKAEIEEVMGNSFGCGGYAMVRVNSGGGGRDGRRYAMVEVISGGGVGYDKVDLRG